MAVFLPCSLWKKVLGPHKRAILAKIFIDLTFLIIITVTPKCLRLSKSTDVAQVFTLIAKIDITNKIDKLDKLGKQ